jgi:3-isopropylmalate/(R)-2-methylmalate dehydratase small subunit
MDAFVSESGISAPLQAANVDTDVIMPKQFLKGVDRNGLRDGLFHDVRFDESGRERPDFVLNRPEWRNAKFLVVGPNFGCGSSREHAVWGLMQYGIRALVGTTFAGIFFDNCARNGLLAITLGEEQIDTLMAAAAVPRTNQLTINLDAQNITGQDLSIDFEIDAIRKNSHLQGLDAIGRTLTFRDEISAFQIRHLHQNPWLA